MSARDHQSGFEPGRGYHQDDWDAVSDHPKLSDEQIAALRPADEVLPATMINGLKTRRPRGPQKTPTKTLVSIRLDQRVLDHFKASGEGWQSRINEALLKVSGL